MQVLTGWAVGVGMGLFSLVQVIWAKEAGIYFDFQKLPGLGIPVIRDMDPPPTGEGQLGDIELSFRLDVSDEVLAEALASHPSNGIKAPPCQGFRRACGAKRPERCPRPGGALLAEARPPPTGSTTHCG
jgi:hypothetical protein